jgi:ubiquinone biosynthesis UbiH/UbiF/VisC/COQ6 family hydroxylase
MSNESADIIIVGAGMVGAATACMLARAGLAVQLVETTAPRPWSSEEPVGLRVSALSPGSQNILVAAGVWQQIAAQRQGIYRRMRVEDGDERAVLDFTAAEFGLDRLGSIVENDLVQYCLWQQVQMLASIEVICPARVLSIRLQPEAAQVELGDGRKLSAPLLVGADGAASTVRKAMGVDQQHWNYNQQGIVCVVQSAPGNPGLAWQRFMPGGPLAFLPLADGSNSIVWSRPDAEARELLALNEVDFLQRLQAAVAGVHEPEGLFGELQSCGTRASFPLTMSLCDSYTAPSAVLLGDAAHVVHPLAGQGANLGLLDAAALVETLLRNRKQGKSLNEERSLQAWSRWRRSESELVARGIHGIHGLFAVRALAPLRRLGLSLLSRSWYGKEAFVHRAAGLNRNAPAIARGLDLGQLMR